MGQSSLEDGVISIKHDVSWMLDFEAHRRSDVILFIMKKADSFNLSDHTDHEVSCSEPELKYFC